MSTKVLVLSHPEVAELHAQGGGQWSYIDVRTTEEFDTGHIPGAYNVPLKYGGLAGFTENPDFVAVVQRNFDTHGPLILGCHSGGRARTAYTKLFGLGFTTLRLHADSLVGSRDHFGRPTTGWTQQGYILTTDITHGHSYEELRGR